ncbi:hypothetical protein AB6A40_010102 [Gnathostoma spinigerum]|uniref:C2H2-type domain-containing protein n=1 Tax=Gnathostoma spinigerum TaxID=75299 RepID=A0ABD6ETW1_9BILA
MRVVNVVTGQSRKRRAESRSLSDFAGRKDSLAKNESSEKSKFALKASKISEETVRGEPFSDIINPRAQMQQRKTVLSRNYNKVNPEGLVRYNVGMEVIKQEAEKETVITENPPDDPCRISEEERQSNREVEVKADVPDLTATKSSRKRRRTRFSVSSSTLSDSCASVVSSLSWRSSLASADPPYEMNNRVHHAKKEADCNVSNDRNSDHIRRRKDSSKPQIVTRGKSAELVEVKMSEELKCHWDECDRILSSRKELVDHVANCHIRSLRLFMCRWRECEREEPFKSKYTLVIHVRRHTGEKPNKCTVSLFLPVCLT